MHQRIDAELSDEPVVVMNSRAEIQEAFEEYPLGKMSEIA